VVRETYAGSEAVLAHMANLGDLLFHIINMAGSVEMDGFGDPSPELLEAAELFDASLYRPFQSL